MANANGPRLNTKAVVAGAVGGVLVSGAATGWVAAASYLAKKVVTPERERPDDTEILALTKDTITLNRTAETVVPGRYGLFFDGGQGHARFGEILHDDPAAGRITRRLEGVDEGLIHPGPARFHSYYFAYGPERSLGLPTEHVRITSPVGALPGWLVPSDRGDLTTWAILVHGRGAGCEETIRAISVLHDAGLTTLSPSYRNDGVAPDSSDGLYGLGISEWQDIHACIEYAMRRGAQRVVLVGWSMGGAIVLQTLVNSPLADRVAAVILDGPVVDWSDVLHHHAKTMGVPVPLTNFSLKLLNGKVSRALVGNHNTIDVAATNFVQRADELTVPILLIHSVDDEFVPVGPSQALAVARPDLVQLEEYREARHCKEWNYDPIRWESSVARFLAARLAAV